MSQFGLLHEFWVIPIAKMTYTRLQNYTNTVVGEHGIQTFEVVVVVLLLLLLLFDVYVSTSPHPIRYSIF